VDVELYNDWPSMNNDSQSVQSNAAQKPSIPTSPQQIDLDSELRSLTPGIFDLSIPPLFGDCQFNFEQPTINEFNLTTSFSDTCPSANDGNTQTHGMSENVTSSSSIHDFLDFGIPQALGSQPTPSKENFMNMEGFISNSSGADPPPTSAGQSEDHVLDNFWPQFIASAFPLVEAPNDHSTEALLNQIELPDIDPPLLMFPLAESNVLGQSPQCRPAFQLNPETQAKLEKLRAHKEAVRKLEAELYI